MMKKAQSSEVTQFPHGRARIQARSAQLPSVHGNLPCVLSICPVSVKRFGLQAAHTLSSFLEHGEASGSRVKVTITHLASEQTERGPGLGNAKCIIEDRDPRACSTQLIL
jgi:hypothetical protein